MGAEGEGGRVTLTVVMNDYNIHSKACMNKLCIFFMYVLHMYMNMDECG
jgi:hypothetical protein